MPVVAMVDHEHKSLQWVRRVAIGGLDGKLHGADCSSPKHSLITFGITPQIGAKPFIFWQNNPVRGAQRPKVGSNPFATRSREPYIDCCCPLRTIAWTTKRDGPRERYPLDHTGQGGRWTRCPAIVGALLPAAG